jgi:hypothetical protein
MDIAIAPRPFIAMDAVTSSQIAEIGHDAETHTLAIRFVSKSGPGSTYHYSNFDGEQFAAFKSAASIGSHFKTLIKPFPDRYPYVKVS